LDHPRKVKDVDQAQEGARVTSLMKLYQSFYFVEGSWTVYYQNKESFRFLLWSVTMVLAKCYVWTAKLVCA